MGIDLATWRARIGLNYYHMCRPLQTRWRSSGGQLYHPEVASWGVGKVMNDTPLVLKGCMAVVALSLILQYVVHSWSKLKGRGGSGKVRCHWRESTSQVRGTVGCGGTLLLRAIVVVIPLLLVIAGDVETNPGPEAPNLRVLLDELHPVYASWFNIGLQLGIPYHKLECLKQMYLNPSELMREMLAHWFKTAIAPRPSWEAVVAALRSPSVDAQHLAEQLESKFCTPIMHESNSPFTSKAEKSKGAVLTLNAAISALHSVCNKWYNIGVQLKLPTFQLKNIEKRSSDSMDQLRDTLDYWMSNDPSPSWRHLIDVLKAPSVGENRLAEKIEKKYCGPEEQSSCDESVASVQTKYYQVDDSRPHLSHSCEKCKVLGYNSRRFATSKGKTPYQEKKHRVWGVFHCPNCYYSWSSGNTWANQGQKCMKCGITVYPNLQRPRDKQYSDDHYLAICEQVMRESGKMDQIIMHCIFVGPPGVGKSSLLKRLLRMKLDPNRTSTQVVEKSVQVEIIRDVSTAVAQVSGIGWQIIEDPISQASGLVGQLSTNPVKISKVGDQVSKEVEGAITTKQIKEDTVGGSTKWVSRQLLASQVPKSKVSKHTTSERSEPSQRYQFHRFIDFLRHVLKEKGVSGLEQNINPWTLYMTDSGGQPEFQELLPALVVGPCVFFVVLPLNKELNEKYKVDYMRPDEQKYIQKYLSSLTVQEDLMRSLASIASTQYMNKDGKEVKPRVMLIATFKDKVPQKKDRQRKLKEIEVLVRETDAFRQGMIVDASETQVVFTINNVSDEESTRDTQVIRDAFQKIAIGFHVNMPSPWLFFSILVQHEYAKDSVISKNECFEIAKECGIHNESEFEAALQFLHRQTGVLHYYKEPPELSQIVIKDPQYLFSRVNQLVEETFTFDQTQCSQCTDDFKKGIFKLTDYETLTNKFGQSKLNPSMLLKLLEHLNIIVPLGDGERYFMPCAIAHLKEDTSVGHTRSTTIPPLLITFKSGYCPKGLFGALVACIANKQVANCTLNLDESKIHRDQICFTMDQHCLLLKVNPTYIYIGVIPYSPDTPLSTLCTVCNGVRKLILKNIKNACQTLHYSDNANCCLSFECPCNQYDQHKKFHPAVLRSDLNNCFRCIQSKKVVDVWKECYIWLSQPNIIQHPVPQSVASETEAVFRVESTGESLQFQWQRNCIDLCDNGRYCDTNTDTLRIIEVTKSDKGRYRCLVNNDVGRVFSDEALLTVTDPPRVTQHPKDQLVSIGTDIILNVGAIGDGLQFQWQKNCSDLCDGGRYFATNTDTLCIVQVKDDDRGHYRCLVMNDVGRKFSDEAFLTIKLPDLPPVSPPGILQQSGQLAYTQYPSSQQLYSGGDNITLSEQDLHILTEIMRPAIPQWRTIGGSLGFLNSDLNIIQHRPLLIPEGTLGYFREMLSQWLKWAPPNHPWPTLKALSVALQSSGHECLAVNLASFYEQRKADCPRVTHQHTAYYNWKKVLKTGVIICILVLVLLAGLGFGVLYLPVRKDQCKDLERPHPDEL